MDNLPIGSILIWGGNANALPSNWRVCDGSSLRKTVFSDLYTVLGENWLIDSASSVEFFNIPDLRGVFLRGVNNNRFDNFKDPDVNLRVRAKANIDKDTPGSLQMFQIQRHSHALRAGGGSSGPREALAQDSYNSYNYPMSEVGGNETRPSNAYVYYIIKISDNSLPKSVVDSDIFPPPIQPIQPDPIPPKPKKEPKEPPVKKGEIPK